MEIFKNLYSMLPCVAFEHAEHSST
jgi:hypothetical protein